MIARPVAPRILGCAAILACFLASGFAATAHPHLITFGKSTPVKLLVGPDEDRTEPIKVRSLLVDGRAREFVTGDLHEVTDRLFVVRRAFRLNNNLPADEAKAPAWLWQRGGWLLIDRLTGRVSQLALHEFDPFYSEAAWFRDYAAYCGVSDNGEKLSAVVVQLGRKKPVLKKDLGAASQGDDPAADCSAPTWERRPTRVTFHPKRGEKQSFSIFGHAWDAAPGSDDE